jgi:hypothetical protein
VGFFLIKLVVKFFLMKYIMCDQYWLAVEVVAFDQ